MSVTRIHRNAGFRAELDKKIRRRSIDYSFALAGFECFEEVNSVLMVVSARNHSQRHNVKASCSPPPQLLLKNLQRIKEITSASSIGNFNWIMQHSACASPTNYLCKMHSAHLSQFWMRQKTVNIDWERSACLSLYPLTRWPWPTRLWKA